MCFKCVPKSCTLTREPCSHDSATFDTHIANPECVSLCAASTLALLFLLDCDELAFHALGTTARREAGALILTKKAEQLLNVVRSAHIVILTVAIPLTVSDVIAIATFEEGGFDGGHMVAWMVCLLPIMFAFPIAGVVEVLADTNYKTAKDRLRGVLKVICKSVAGLLLILFTMIPIFIANVFGHMAAVERGDVENSEHAYQSTGFERNADYDGTADQG